jgi:hypothetical protein
MEPPARRLPHNYRYIRHRFPAVRPASHVDVRFACTSAAAGLLGAARMRASRAARARLPLRTIGSSSHAPRCGARSITGRMDQTPLAAVQTAPTSAAGLRPTRPLLHPASWRRGSAPRQLATDVVIRAVRRPWRTRCSGCERATAEQLRTRDRRRRGASADAPRAHDRRQQDPETLVLEPLRPPTRRAIAATFAGSQDSISRFSWRTLVSRSVLTPKSSV